MAFGRGRREKILKLVLKSFRFAAEVAGRFLHCKAKALMLEAQSSKGSSATCLVG